MEHNIRTPDGNVREISLVPQDGELKFTELGFAFEKVGNDSLWLLDGAKKTKLHATKIKDTWWIHLNGKCWKLDLIEAGSSTDDSGDSGLTAPMPGTILEVLVSEGDEVTAGQTLLVMEAMKMEHKITAPKDGLIEVIHFQSGERCEQGAKLISLS